MEIVVKTLAGLEEVLAAEVKNTLQREPTVLRRAVKFDGEFTDAYRANYLLRTASRVLVQLFEFRASSEENMYKAIKKYNWEEHLDVKKTFLVDCVMNSELFRNSHFLSLKAKDAIVDRFRERHDQRPSIDKDRPDVIVHVHVFQDKFTVYLDSSGSSLHLRGYKHNFHPASMSEVLAAGLIQLSGWDAKTPFRDIMCGSGTLVAEAAMLAHNIPAGFFRKRFGFENWANFNREAWTEIKQENSPQPQENISVTGSDKNGQHIGKCLDWVEETLLKDLVHFEQSDFKNLTNLDENTWIFANPPYGERLQVDELETLYGDLGRWLKFDSGVRNAWIFSASPEGVKKIGLKPAKKLKLMNGNLDAQYLGYTLYRKVNTD